jgi:hypothetical protein
MFNKLKNYCHKFSSDIRGSVAIETSIILPLILVPMTLATVDVGIAINSGQSLTSASRSGSQYLLNGGTDETALKNVIIDSYNGSLTSNSITIATSCACPNDDALPPDNDGEGSTETNTSEPGYRDEDPYEQITSVTLATIEQCSSSCPDQSRERVLVDLSVSHTSKGLYKDYPISNSISVRIK